MIPRHKAGFATALILWMIAGMSLMVAAVIHFARTDTSAVELRLAEAKSSALGRGVALLALRDRDLAASKPLSSADLDEQSEEDAEQETGSALYRADFRLNNMTIVAEVFNAAGYVSLTTGPKEELMVLLSQRAGLSEAEAEELTDALLAYRDEVEVLYPEQLLAVPGMSRDAYEAIRSDVHAFPSGTFSVSQSPSRIRALFLRDDEAEQGEHRDASRLDEDGGEVPASGAAVCTALTFECLDRQRSSAAGAEGIVSVELEYRTEGDRRLWQRIWVDSTNRSIVRAEPVRVMMSEGKSS